MASITITSTSQTPPQWAGDFLSRDHLVPGGFQVDASAWTADGDGRKTIPSGTVLGRTFAERDAGDGFGPAADTDDEIYILAWDVTDAVKNTDCELYRFGSVVKENLLPDWATLSAAVKAAIRANYTTIKGDAS